MSLANKFGIPQGLLDAAKAALDEANEYQKKVQAHMAKKGIKSMSDMTPDQKKKFFNELDAMHTAKHEEVEPIEELSKQKLASHAAQAGAMAQMHNTQVQRSSDASEIEKHSKLASKRLSGAAKAHRKLNAEEFESVEEGSEVKPKPSRLAPAVRISNHSLLKPVTGPNKLKGYVPYEKEPSKAKNEEFESVEEELKGDMHPDAHKVLKHIKPEHHGTYKPYLKKGTYKGDYKDRSAVLSAAEKAGHVKEEVELTQEDLDFIASVNQAEVVEGQLRNISPHSDLAGRGRLSGYNTTAAGKKREADRETERLKDKMKFTKSQGGIAGPKGKLPEEVELDEEQLDELNKDTVASYAGKAGRALGGHVQALSKAKDIGKMSYPEKSGDAIKSTLKRNIANRKAGLDRAERRLSEEEQFDLEDFTLEQIEEYMQTEEFAQLDELEKTTLASYIKKRSHDVATQGALTRKHAMDAEAKKKEHGGYTTKAVRDLDDKANRAFMKGWKHRENIAKAVDRLTKG